MFAYQVTFEGEESGIYSSYSTDVDVVRMNIGLAFDKIVIGVALLGECKEEELCKDEVIYRGAIASVLSEEGEYLYIKRHSYNLYVVKSKLLYIGGYSLKKRIPAAVGQEV